MVEISQNILSASDTTSQSGIQIDSRPFSMASFHGVFSDTSVAGTVFIQGSNDIGELPFTVNDWANIPGAGATVVGGSPVIIPLNPVCYRWLRAVFVCTVAGTSTINVNMLAKVE